MLLIRFETGGVELTIEIFELAFSDGYVGFETLLCWVTTFMLLEEAIILLLFVYTLLSKEFICVTDEEPGPAIVW